MRTAETILTIIQERGKQGLPLERVYRLLYNKDLYLRAYARLYANNGAMTKGSTDETVDEMSQKKIEQLIVSLQAKTFRWTPVRRVQIPKKNGKMRPLGIPSWSDKLLQEVIRSILEAYYDVQFSDCSHGFRPERGCHSALQTIQHQWTGTRWFIEGDIAQYFDTIDHGILIDILGKTIKDERFLWLIQGLLQAGYLEEWTYHPTLSGSPQGGVVSPLLSNIYLNELDQYIVQTLIPACTRGKTRKEHLQWKKLTKQIGRMKKEENREEVKRLKQQRNQIPAKDPNDPNYRRLRYVRYADDFLLGFAGTKAEAEQIKQAIGAWLHEHLKLTLSEEKTLITHAVSGTARFLGYDIVNQQENNQHTAGRRRINGRIGLRVPTDVLKKKIARYMRKGKIVDRREHLVQSDYTIVALYQAEYRGIVQYYQLAYNVSTLYRLQWVMWGSLLRTLANKHKISSKKIHQRYVTKTTTPEGKTLRCLEVKVARNGKPPLIARFGGLSLIRKPLAILNDQPPKTWNQRTELLERLLADTCELCGSREKVEVHHVHKLADLNQRGRKTMENWKRYMIARRRKTIVACRTCHLAIHQGTIDQRLTERGTSWKELLESRVQ
ncbi:maturase [Reticulibacter mediterranei]|uniref:Maturase n=1 Tax=Reticulibacter mediterranei TaxID=2778369 RepID=A0A8J3IMV1_9CHLR|nr:reverse transcriptase domain-containing protein [Reticulibacter mediterranei]GHO93151.1 maturase [Reticulibacter mediterranei]GHO96076.1 maturase [Reticulibacter mediterranei]GHO96335.1 maturase [Reticulibacter mediterranei]GHO97265.1 maturase [Reticulibacter mediterranei]